MNFTSAFAKPPVVHAGRGKRHRARSHARSVVLCGWLVVPCTMGFASAAVAAPESPARVLVLFNTVGGGTLKLARAVAEGVDSVPGVTAVIKQIPRIAPAKADDMTAAAYAVASPSELADYDGLAIGSPVHFGTMSADMRYFLDQTIGLWTGRKLEGKPATVFMSASSGGTSELAIASTWWTLASHGMVIVPLGNRAGGQLDKSSHGGNTPLGAISFGGVPGPRPSPNEQLTAFLQGAALAKVALALRRAAPASNGFASPTAAIAAAPKESPQARLLELGIELPALPPPAGSYVPYKVTQKLVYINQVAFVSGKILHSGIIGLQVSTDEAEQATRQTMLNVLAALKEAAGGNLDNVKSVVQLTGIFATPPGFTGHAGLMNVASDLAVAVFGESGRHARGTLGAASLPLGSPVEIQAVFELR